MSLNLPKRWWVAPRPFDQWEGIPFWQCPKRQGPASPFRTRLAPASFDGERPDPYSILAYFITSQVVF